MIDKAVIYRTHFEAIENLPEDQQLAALKAIIKFCMDDTEPEEGTVAAAIFGMARPIMAKWKSNVLAGSKGGEATAKQVASKSQASRKQPPSKSQPKEESIKHKDKNINKRERFVAPTVEEVRAYCAERGNRIDAQAFVDFYASKGWKVGSQPMKDWRAAIRTWERRDKEKPPGRRTAFHNFPARDDQEHKDLVAQVVAMQ